MVTECHACGVKREHGWLLVDGFCRACNPEGFQRRVEELWRQAKQIMEDRDSCES